LVPFNYITIDSGKYATKALLRKPDGTDKSLVFRTKIEETIKNEAQGNSYIVTYNGKRYLLGEQAGASSTSAKSSKAEELHKICTSKIFTTVSAALALAGILTLGIYKSIK